MTEIRITHDIDSLNAAISRAPGVINQALGRALQRGALVVQRRAREKAPKRSSGLTNAILVEKTGTLEQAVIADKESGASVEFGRSAGQPMPPIQSLVDWIRHSPKIVPNDPRMDERDLAFVIGRKIARDGIEAQPFMGPALEESRDELDAIMRRSLANAIDKVFA